MLSSYITVFKGKVLPIGEGLFVTDLDHGWKKRKMTIAVESGANRYNLVQLQPSPKSGQKFKIADSDIKPKAKARKPTPSPPLVKSASCHGERDLKVPRANAPSTLPKPSRYLQSSGRSSADIVSSQQVAMRVMHLQKSMKIGLLLHSKKMTKK